MAKRRQNPGVLLRNAGIFNPVLVQAVGLCPVVAIATSLKNALLLAAVASLIIVVNECFASLFFKVIPRWVRIGLYMIIGCLLILPVMYLLETNAAMAAFGTLGIYLPLMAVNSLVVLRCERFAVKIKPLAALTDALTASVGYSVVLILTGIVRELLGSGKIAGHEVWKFTFPAMLLPFGGFLFIGFAAAALRFLISVYHPKYLDKKQPKPKDPKEKKRLRPAPVPKPNANFYGLDLSIGESPFSDEEIENELSEKEPEAAEEKEEEKTVIVEELPEEAEIAAEPFVPEAEIPVAEEESKTTITDESAVKKAEATDEPVVEETEVPDEPQAIIVPHAEIPEASAEELLTSDDSAEEIVDDEELARLMSRSLDDILSDAKRETDSASKQDEEV